MCRYILIVHQGENLESTGQRGVDQVEGKRECNVAGDVVFNGEEHFRKSMACDFSNSQRNLDQLLGNSSLNQLSKSTVTR